MPLARALIRRVCWSCATIVTSRIRVGMVLFFNVGESFLGRSGCNLCDFFRDLHTDMVEYTFRHITDLPNTTVRKTTPTRAIRVEVVQKVSDMVAVPSLLWSHPGMSGVVFEATLEDTWYGNKVLQEIYFRGTDTPSPRLGFCPETTVLEGDSDTPHGMLSTSANLALAKEWLQECVRDHPDCVPIVTRNEGLLPGSALFQQLHPMTRFIDVRLRRLVQLDEIMSGPFDYVALSYVWGKEYQLKTMKEDLVTFKHRLPWDATHFDEVRLPNTIRDAMLVTLALGYRFLWVDALCIVQDSMEDLTIQLSQMEHIYSLAVVSIVARSSASSDSGLKGVSSPRSCMGSSNVEVMVHDGLAIGRWEVLTMREEYEETQGVLADKDRYMWRGWTFQEQILSTRTLEFNSDRMLFWCGKDRSRQESGHPSFATSEPSGPHHFRWAVRQFRRNKHRQETPDDEWIPSSEWMTDDMLHELWRSIRQNYSMRSLSYPSDRQRAVMGTAKALNGVSGGIDTAGHLVDNLHEEVVWFLDTMLGGYPAPPVKISRELAPEGFFPSWSWLNLWPVVWPESAEPLPGVSLRIVRHSGSEFGPHTALEINAPVVTLLLVDTEDGGQDLTYNDFTTVGIGALRLDASLPSGVELTGVPIACAMVDFQSEWEILLLRPSKEHFVRVGIASLLEEQSQTLENRMNNSARKSIRCI